MGQVYGRLVRAVDQIEKEFKFSHDDRLGFLTFCPTNLGTTIRFEMTFILSFLWDTCFIKMFFSQGECSHQVAEIGGRGRDQDAPGARGQVSVTG